MRLFLVVISFLMVACNPKSADKPENLIGEEKMAELLYELSIINASRGFRPSDGKEVISVNSSFFDFHQVDSLQFSLSNAYYAARPKQYLKIVELSEQLLASREDSLIGSQKIKKPDAVKVLLNYSEKQPDDVKK